MFKLLKPEDKLFLDNTNFSKNAVFYKDMLCFYEAYNQIRDREKSLPNFCFVKKNELCLEGICLLMKMYATEFKFETLKLTLDYLKILYFTIASYAEGDEVSHDVIAKEFEEYRFASIDYCNEQRDAFEEKEKEVSKQEKELKSKLQRVQKLQRRGKVNSILTIVCLIASILLISAPILVMNYLPENKILFGCSIAVVALGFVLTIVLKIAIKSDINNASDLQFHTQNLKKKHEADVAELLSLQGKYYKVFCEKYEYKTFFSEVFSKYAEPLSMDEILARVKKYKILSYNKIYDIGRLFKTQQMEISGLVSELESITPNMDYKKELSEIYSKICEQDWLYYNSEIRLHFLKKVADIAEKEYSWKLEFNGKKINPFGINVREIANDMVAFSSERGKKMIAIPYSEFVKTKYFKNLEKLNFKNGYTFEELKKVKANYLGHFYRYNILKKLTNVFYDRKENQKLKGLEFPIDEMEQVPTIVGLKLKLIENVAGLGNSDAGVIKSLAQSLFPEMSVDVSEIKHLTDDDIEYPKFKADRIEEFEDYFVYYVGDEQKIGYKF